MFSVKTSTKTHSKPSALDVSRPGKPSPFCDMPSKGEESRSDNSALFGLDTKRSDTMQSTRK